MLSITEAAARKGISRGRLHAIIKEQNIKLIRLGNRKTNQFMIEESVLDGIKVYRKSGRPKTKDKGGK